jgi:hypothetical protein
MKRYQFRCKTCSTSVNIETELPESLINYVSPCPCESTDFNLADHEKKETLWDA